METNNSPQNQPGPSFKVLLASLITVLVLGAGFLYAAKYFDIWPYSEQSSPDEQTYKSDDYGFELSYPKSWHHEECRDSGPGGTYLLVSFGDVQDLVVCNSDAPILGYVNITVLPGSIDQREIDSVFTNVDNPNRQNVTIDGNSAVRVEGTTKQQEGPAPEPGLKYIAIWTERSGALYRFIFIGKAEDAAKFDRVVSTFKFGVKTGGKNEEWETYYNPQFGMELKLPPSWKGYKVLTQQWEGQPLDSRVVSQSGPLIILRHPKWTEQNHYEDMPIMVFTPFQWNLVQEGKLSVGAAPVPPSELGRNSKYIIALPARYNYDFAIGWEEVDQLVHTIMVFEPTS